MICNSDQNSAFIIRKLVSNKRATKLKILNNTETAFL